jgi:hypothetical protein
LLRPIQQEIETVCGVLILDLVKVARPVQPPYLSLIELSNFEPRTEHDGCHRLEDENETHRVGDTYRAERILKT